MTGVLISEIEAWAVSLPLSQPIDLGNFIVHQRSHLAVRVRTKDGLTGECVTQTRGSPLDVIVSEVLAPRLVGKDALDIPARQSELARELTALEMDGAIGRAWSAIEICLNDLRAQAAGLPLWRLLGGQPRQVQVELVEGYSLVGESCDGFAERLAKRVDEGFSFLKIEAGHYRDLSKLRYRLSAFRKLAGPVPRLILDFAWSWRNAAGQLDVARSLQDYGVEWLEDPFPRSEISQYRHLRQNSPIPIGCGDETTRASDIQALMEAQAIDVVRLDATTIGGIGAVSALSSEAKDRGLTLSFHEHPEIHEHCVFGFASADHVEVFPTDRPFDRVHDLLQDNTFSRISGGLLAPAEAPGLNMRLRSDAITAFAHRHTRVAL